jgi:hypothetical protein
MLGNLIAIDKNPIFIKFAETLFGKLILIFFYSLIILNIDSYSITWRQVGVVTILFISIMPKHRYLWLFIGMLCLLFQGSAIRPQIDWVITRMGYLLYNYEIGSDSYLSLYNIKNIDTLCMLLVSETLIYLGWRFHKFKITHYPVTISYIFLIALMCIACYAPLSKLHIIMLWFFINIYNHYFWFVGYTLIETPLIKHRNYLLDYGRYLPVWGFTTIPYGKGSIYLKEVESTTRKEFAITQLNGLKLAVWALILFFVFKGMGRVYNYYNIPDLNAILDDYAQGKFYRPMRAWVYLWATFFYALLQLTVMGHFFVSTCRLCGFKILRNTYKPLQATSVVEYWNRYNFYYKEMLAIFFFYPAYFRFFKNHTKLRLFFATLCAATFGNCLVHFLATTPIMMMRGLTEACWGFIPFLFYTIVLGISIGISQLRHLSDNKPLSKFKRYIGSPFLVLFLYSILGIFNQDFQSQSIMVNFKFLASLFNITW